MANVPKKDKPGCYGFTLYNPDSVRCSTCKVADSCQPLALASLKRLSYEMDVSDCLSKHTKFTGERYMPTQIGSRLTAVQKTELVTTLEENIMLSHMSQNGRMITRRLLKKGIDIASSLSKGENPFDNQKPAFLKVPCDLLLRGTFTKADLNRAFTEECVNWNERTVKTHVTLTLNMFTVLKVVDCIDNQYTLRQK